MKPATFAYFAPTTLAEAVALLQEHEDAKVVSGGQSLVPAMNMRLARPPVLVDINRIGDLDYIREQDGGIVIGGLTRHYDVETSALLRAQCPLLAEAAGHIGYPAIRHRGTMGGTVAHNDPAATIPVVLRCLGAAIGATGPDGKRTFSTEEFFLGIYTTAVTPAEIVTEVWVPVLTKGTGWSWQELTRHAGDFALVAVAATLSVAAGKVAAVSICLGGVGDGPVKATAAEAALLGQPATAASFAKAGEVAAKNVDPESDIHASAEYRKEMVKVFVGRALQQALSRAQGGK